MEAVLLILESVLLVFTIVLLLYSIREGKERKAIIMEVGKATKILTRQEYFLAVTDAMLDAKDEVIGCITGRLPKQEDRKRTADITGRIENIMSHGVTVKYLMPKFPDRLHIGTLYSKAGAEVRYSNCLAVHDTRYIVVDDALAVIGIPEGEGDKESTKKGYRIPSEGLADILRDYFYRCWDSSTTHEEYVRELIRQTGTSPKQLAREFDIDLDELERLALK
ncbi:MAG: hypothetical protein EPN22_13970 [Nitrospirae bacterium]|nr:MAG: hypothetical protein EPN22_13970 [Nitrospirota bacterium]